MLIVAALLQAGFRRSHLLYLVYALAGLLLARSSLGAVQPAHPQDLVPAAWELNIGPISAAQSSPALERLVSLKGE
jgi:hypothetical protein